MAVPRYTVAPAWPKPLPAPKDAKGMARQWVTAEVGGSCADVRVGRVLGDAIKFLPPERLPTTAH